MAVVVFMVVTAGTVIMFVVVMVMSTAAVACFVIVVMLVNMCVLHGMNRRNSVLLHDFHMILD